jgi:hypothetical protein
MVMGMADTREVHRRASDIYSAQNRVLHKAFALEGLPYEEDKVVWLQLMSDIAGRDIGGLSEMTLSERHKLIAHFQSKGLRLLSPGVGHKIRDWKKGDPDIEYEYREDGDPQVRMAYAIWAEMGYRPKTLRGLCFKLFKCDDPRWLNDGQLSRLVNVVRNKAAQKGLGNYYRRGVG